MAFTGDNAGFWVVCKCFSRIWRPLGESFWVVFCPLWGFLGRLRSLFLTSYQLKSLSLMGAGGLRHISLCSVAVSSGLQRSLIYLACLLRCQPLPQGNLSFLQLLIRLFIVFSVFCCSWSDCHVKAHFPKHLSSSFIPWFLGTSLWVCDNFTELFSSSTQDDGIFYLSILNILPFTGDSRELLASTKFISRINSLLALNVVRGFWGSKNHAASLGWAITI